MLRVAHFENFFPFYLSISLKNLNLSVKQLSSLLQHLKKKNIFWKFFPFSLLEHGLPGEVPKRLSLSSARIIKGLRSFLKMPLVSRAWLGHLLPLPPLSIYSGNPTPSRQRQLAAMAALKSSDQATPDPTPIKSPNCSGRWEESVKMTHFDRKACHHVTTNL
jgi:hypothetical protein